jgi:hypothetical protein
MAKRCGELEGETDAWTSEFISYLIRIACKIIPLFFSDTAW